ncbi:replication protein A 30 kDa subunit [Dugong dugon]
MSKSGFGSYSRFSAAGGASGDNGQPSRGGATPPAKPRRPKAQIHNIIPCCVNQLLTSTLVDNVFKIRGIEISQVSIVGIIRQAERAPHYILYKIDDMTSKPIEVRQWFDGHKAKQEMIPLPVGVYAKVFGILKCTGEAKSLEVLKIRILEDMNEFTAHILETVNAHMTLYKARQATTGESTPVAPSGMDAAVDYGKHHLSFIRKEVLRLIRECPRLEGKSIRELQTELRSVSIRAIKEAIDYLTIEGHVYSSVDNEHFKSAD